MQPKLLDLFLRMYMIRRAEELIIEHYPEDEMRTPMHMSMGAEGIAVGVCTSLTPEDQVLTSYRSHAVFLAKTADLESFFGELYGRVTGTADGRSGSMHLALPAEGHMVSSAVVGSQLPMALGLAYANKVKRNGRRVVVFFGDGATDEGVFWESLNVACLMKLPVLFVCEDNDLSVMTPWESRRGYRSFLDVVFQYRCIADYVEGWDVEQVSDSMDVMLGANPGVLEARYYRYLEHVGTGTDFHLGYRPDPGADWSDPVRLAREKLLVDSVSSPTLDYHERSVDAAVRSAIEDARKAPKPGPDSLYRGVFHEA